ncbi:MAG: sigma 54-interacting transcriptional regulator, partial [Proteobacteria bacterium]|nr:sigma 54-interacting transcriptional regulator [Pseudomonadota bacterium]
RGGTDHPGYAIIDLDLARYDRIASRFEQQRRERSGLLKAGIPTRNKAFNALIAQIERVASASRAPLLLTGPTGAGKTHLARRIYALKKQLGQISGPFVEVNCATLRGDQAMSTLFGHRRGAFTGAVADRDGLLVGANNGVLFLDEIGELGTDEQAMLLSAIEDKRFLPLGSERSVESDFQLIAGTNRDLAERVGRGRFREDLLARINLWHFNLPALADRREDIAPNLDFELDRLTRQMGRRVTFNSEAHKRFLRFATSHQAEWRNNFRDLSAAITRMATLAPNSRIRVTEVEEEVGRLQQMWSSMSLKSRPTVEEQLLRELIGEPTFERLDLFDRLQLALVVDVCRRSTSLSAAGRTLFAQSRLKKRSANDADRLRKYLTRFGLSWSAITSSSSLARHTMTTEVGSP